MFDPEHYWQVTPATLLSQGKNTPFIGSEVAGKVHHTMLNGHLVHSLKGHA
jgi:dihydroorotase